MTTRVPSTLIRTSHAITIKANSVIVGQIQTWAPNQSRTVTPTYQLDSTKSGEVYENVPGNIGGLTIGVSRYDLFKTKMEQAWGLKYSIRMLTDQYTRFEVTEKWANPDSSTETLVYEDCWFSQLGRNLSAEGNRIVMVNGTLGYARVHPL